MQTALAQLKEHHFDPVRDSQLVFRDLMMALAFPGQQRRLRRLPLAIARADVAHTLTPLLTLLDLETTFHVASADPSQQQTITDYLTINTNSRATPCEAADFVLCLDAGLGNRFATLKKGSLAQPNESATVFYRVEELAGEPGQGRVQLSLEGPGIRSRQMLWVKGLASAEFDHWTSSRKGYPLGIDIYLISPTGDLVGIPRSVGLSVSGGHA
ncbi:MAG: phosphonate C-P lyase system protein PhnH [Desulfosarcinaceae bacterium]|nr:phosphonate C-P lyase system protein PhnH [Desulfosarcinaceae bacterium]